MCWVYTCSTSVVCMYLYSHPDTSSVAQDYVLATRVGGGLTLNVKRQQELKFAHSSVPTPPQAANCCLSRAVSCKLRLQRGALMEERDRGSTEKGKVDGEQDSWKSKWGGIFLLELKQDAVITATAHLFPHSQSVLHGTVCAKMTILLPVTVSITNDSLSRYCNMLLYCDWSAAGRLVDLLKVWRIVITRTSVFWV